MSNWIKIKDQNFSDIDRNKCCDYIMMNSNNQFYCEKYDLLIELGEGMEGTAVAMFCGQSNINEDLCWAKVRCANVLFKEKNELENIIKLNTELIEKNPKDPEGYKNRGIFNSMIFTNMNNCRFSFNPGWVKVLEEHFDNTIKEHAETAIKDLSAAIELNSEDADVFSLRGEVYSQLKDYTNALADFNKATEIDDKCKNAYLFRGTMYSTKGEYEKAITDLEYILNFFPDDELIPIVLNKTKQLKTEKDANGRFLEPDTRPVKHS